MTAITIPILLIIIATISVLLFILTATLFYQKYQSNKITKQKQHYIHTFKDDWYEFLMNGAQGSVAMIPKTDSEYSAIETIFLSYLKNMHTQKSTIRIYDFANEYLISHYEKQLASRKWSTKMNALYRIYDFRISELLPQCEQLKLEQLDDDMLLQLLKIYALLQPAKLFDFVLSPSRDLPEIDYKQLFMIIESRSLQKFMDHFEQLQPHAQVALIDAVGLSQNTVHLPQLIQLLQSEDVEIRIRTLKVLCQLSHVGDLTVYEPFTSSPIWEERLMVAKILRNYPIEESLPLLQTLLEDTHYQVRYEASQTFTGAKNGERWIQQFLHSSTDVYAVDMVKSSLKQKGLKI